MKREDIEDFFLKILRVAEYLLVYLIKWGGLSGFIFLNIWYVTSTFEKNTINIWEIRYYVFLLFGVLLLIGLGILRQYNATVKNTSFLITLSKKLGSFTTAVGDFTRTMKGLNADRTREISLFDKTIKTFMEVIKTIVR